MDSSDLERLFGWEARQDPREAPSEHRLASPRGPAEQQVVTASRGELERTTSALLPAHVREVGRGTGVVTIRGHGLDRRRLPLAAEVRDCLREVVKWDGLDAGKRRLGRRLG